MNKVIILPAWHNGPENNWYPYLKKKLQEKDYSVVVPELPTMKTDLPDMGLQLKAIKKLVDKETILIGHSLSCLLTMRLAEMVPYKKMFLVAGWDFDDLTVEHRLFWQNKINHAKIKKNVKEIFCFSSDDDPYITAFQGEEMSKRLGGRFILVKGAGHFTRKDGMVAFPQILEYF